MSTARHQIAAKKVVMAKRESLDYKDVVEQWPDAMAEITEQNIDDSNRVIKNICVFGRARSDNGYTYQDKAIEQLAQLVNGANVYINHPSKTEIRDRDGVRDLRDWAGIYYNPHRQGEKIYADFHAREAYFPLVKDIALMKPTKVGNSVNSRVRVYIEKGGAESIVSVDRLNSVDLVASGATIDNLWESAQTDLDSSEEKVLQEMLAILEEHWPNLTRDMQEGILADKIKQDEVRQKASRLMWKANDMIYDALRDKEIKDFKERRKMINSILDDLESELGKILPKIKPDKEGGDKASESTEKGEQRIVVKLPTIVIP